MRGVRGNREARGGVHVTGKRSDAPAELAPSGLPYVGGWVDRLFDGYLAGEASILDLKKGVVLAFHCYAKCVRRDAGRKAAALRREVAALKRLVREPPPVAGSVSRGGASGVVVDEALVPRAECPKCGEPTLRVSAPFELWVSCPSFGYADEFHRGPEWEKYVDVVAAWNLRLLGRG